MYVKRAIPESYALLKKIPPYFCALVLFYVLGGATVRVFSFFSTQKSIDVSEFLFFKSKFSRTVWTSHVTNNSTLSCRTFSAKSWRRGALKKIAIEKGVYFFVLPVLWGCCFMTRVSRRSVTWIYYIFLLKCFFFLYIITIAPSATILLIQLLL